LDIRKKVVPHVDIYRKKKPLTRDLASSNLLSLVKKRYHLTTNDQVSRIFPVPDPPSGTIPQSVQASYSLLSKSSRFTVVYTGTAIKKKLVAILTV